MKTIVWIYFVLGLLVSPLAMARGEEQSSNNAEGYEHFKIDQTWQASFPHAAAVIGFGSGEAHVVIAVDATGTLTDCLVTGYTHRAFADEAVRTVKKWRYEPARLHGEPMSVVAKIDFVFEKEGLTVVTQTPQENLDSRYHEIEKNQYSYRVHTLSELDHLPTPVHVVEPVYPTAWAAKGIVGIVSVEFYIDETGKVRMPGVANTASPPLANLAIDAVQQWQFEPATCKGKPVLVRVSQDFNFGPGKQ
ncbi:MAG TPA: energy transducer TonB [Opitutaceae bacterium]|jgi:TonB family protein|nr:energy transducer TonB [Opitutaceae bacterium]